MVIANPIYDVVFKQLMENDRVAKFFIGTLLDETIESIELKPQEFTYMKDLDMEDPDIQKYVRDQIRERLSINILRLDFIATIKTADGNYKKVMIEIQKAQQQTDLIRFRNYLAEQYKKIDTINGSRQNLPITTIYILGFQLPEIESACIKVERCYKDLINKTILHTKSEFVEKLTHDSYVLQVGRITNRYQTQLDKLLSIFEQRYFINDTETVKEYLHKPDLDEVQLMTGILHYSGTEPAERKKLETEAEAWRTINEWLDDARKNVQRKLEETSRELEETSRELQETGRKLEEETKQRNELLQQLAELRNQLGKQ